MKSYELKPTHENLMETLIRDSLDRNEDIFWFADILNSLEDNCSIAIDGISLTIASSSLSDFSVAVIPHSLELSTLQYLQTGQIVNIEFDVIAKYIEKKLSIYDNSSKISMEFLKENGFI